nr:snrpD2 [Cryptomonas sp.]
MKTSIKRKLCFDYLKNFLDKKVEIFIKNSKKLEGIFYGFDFHANVLLQTQIFKEKEDNYTSVKLYPILTFVRGENIILLKFPSK